MSGLLASIRESLWVVKSYRISYSLLSVMPSGSCLYHFHALPKLYLQFPVNKLSHVIAPLFIVLLSQLARLSHNVWDCFIFPYQKVIHCSYLLGTWCCLSVPRCIFLDHFFLVISSVGLGLSFQFFWGVAHVLLSFIIIIIITVIIIIINTLGKMLGGISPVLQSEFKFH